MKDSCIFYKSFYEAIKELPEENQLDIYKAIFELQFNDNEIDLKGISKSIFTLIKPQLEANNKRYENGKKGAEFGHLGGRPKKENNPKETPKKPQDNPKETPNVNVNDNDNDNVNDNDNEKGIVKGKNISPISLTQKKHKHGEYKHVLLTDEQYAKLLKDYANAEEYIKYLDEYIEMKGYKANNHNLAIRKWVIDAVEKEKMRKVNSTVKIQEPEYYKQSKRKDGDLPF